MHFAKIEGSNRLQKVLRVLEDGTPKTTLEIATTTKLCAVGSAIGELRRNGYNILCRCIRRGVFEYTLLSALLILTSSCTVNINVGKDLQELSRECEPVPLPSMPAAEKQDVIRI